VFIECKCLLSAVRLSLINYNFMAIDNKLYYSNRYKYYHHSPLHHGVGDIEFITIIATEFYK